MNNRFLKKNFEKFQDKKYSVKILDIEKYNITKELENFYQENVFFIQKIFLNLY